MLHGVVRLVVALGFIGVTVVCAIADAPRYDSTVPPEVLKRYDASVLDGTRPRIASVNRAMVWSLRERPDQGADLYTLDLAPSKLSSVQQKVLREWVMGGRHLLLWGYKDCWTYAQLFAELGRPIWGDHDSVQLLRHPVNTDCVNLQFSSSSIPCFAEAAPTCEVLVSCDAGVVVGRTQLGRGSICFVNLKPDDWKEGPDKDRWTLNLHQWLLGLPVPGAAFTSGGLGATGDAEVAEQFDRIVLKNGDVLSGTVVADRLAIRTSYADLEFPLDDVEAMIFEGGGANIETLLLRTGDRLSGVVQQDVFLIALPGGQQVEVARDKIKEILLFRQPN